MKILSPTQHVYLDYLTVVIFLLAPSLIGLTGMAGTIAYQKSPISDPWMGRAYCRPRFGLVAFCTWL